MDNFLKNARKQLEDLELKDMLDNVDLSRIDLDALHDIDFSKGVDSVREQLDKLNSRKREEDAANEGFFGGLVLGAILGAVIALVFAPRSGAETREAAVTTANDLTQKATELVGKATSHDDADASTLPDEAAIERTFGEK